MQTDVTYETFQIERIDDVLVLSYENPPVNALNLKALQELHAIVSDIERDDSIRVVLLRSAVEGMFMAGADVTMVLEVDDEKIAEMRKIGDVFDRLAALPQPVVCSMAGAALGGGLEVALACDFRIMAAGFGEVGLPEVRLGLLPGGGGTQRLTRIVGQAVATEMLIKGMRYTPDKALELNLVHKVVPPEELEAESLKYAQSLAKQAPLAVQYIKRLIRAHYELPAREAFELERELFEKLALSNDSQEGIKAFFEGRKPSFQGN